VEEIELWRELPGMALIDWFSGRGDRPASIGCCMVFGDRDALLVGVLLGDISEESL